MQVNVRCGDCGEHLGGFQLKGSKQEIEIHACYHASKPTCEGCGGNSEFHLCSNCMNGIKKGEINFPPPAEGEE